ncbi:MAG: NUDIX domain-containing protein, partial [Alphaproteobacteria bacterium]
HAVADLLPDLHGAGLAEARWGEDLDVRAGWSGDALLWLERSAADAFGIRSTDVKLVAYGEAGGELALWLGRRAATKRNDPGLWDVTVGGAVASGESIMEALAREAAEEAGLGGTRLEDARRVGRVSYCRAHAAGLQVGSCICFEAKLGLAPGLTPVDGEVDEFVLLPVSHVRKLLTVPGQVLYNSALVLIDFLLRHDAAAVSADEAAALRQALRR